MECCLSSALEWTGLEKMRSLIGLGGRIGRPGLVVTWGKLSQWLFKKNYLLERSIGHILDVSVNANSFPVQCSVIASAALTRGRVLHFLPRKKKFYSLNFHVIDIKHLFKCNWLLYYLKQCFFTYHVGWSTISISQTWRR